MSTPTQTLLRTAPRPPTKRLAHTALILLLAGVTIGGCSMQRRLSEVGREPQLTPIQNPVADPSYQPVSLPMPTPQPQVSAPNSLWRAGARGFFKDQRAARVGDILTITVEINDTATLNNTTTRGRNNVSETLGVTNFFGIEDQLENVFGGTPETDLLDLSSGSNHTGTGNIARTESINLQVAGLITQVLPNGNFVIEGRQEIRVNFEVRELYINGVIRPEDITATNTISYNKIAEARIAYGGRGQITDVQQPRYGQQVLDVFLPF